MNLPTPDKQSYLAAKPFPHCVIDGAFAEADLQYVLLAWPKKHEHFTDEGNVHLKGHTMSEELMDPLIDLVIKTGFFSQEFIRFLEGLTGIAGLVVDPSKAALHETFSGGSLAPHLDYTINPKTGLQLRINVLLYLNENWRPEYNGNLDLYKSTPGYGGRLFEPVVSIEPLFNRMVIFTMDAERDAWHGHSKPLACPEGTSRKSIALNYFSIPQKNAIEQGTIFRKSWVKEILPPFIYKAITKK